MRHIRILGLCALALSASGAVLAASAPADGGPGANTPGFFQCAKAAKEGRPPRYTGEYEHGCLERAAAPKTGEDELEAVEFGSFEGKAKGLGKSKGIAVVAHTTTGAPITVTCSKGKYLGELTEADNVNFELTFTFEKCRAGKKQECGNIEEGTIQTTRLEGQLVWLNAAGSEAGVLLAPFSYLLAKFQCATSEVELAGALIGAAALGGKTASFTFATNTQGEQALKSFQYGSSSYGPLYLYTKAGSGKREEATLVAGATQQATGGVY